MEKRVKIRKRFWRRDRPYLLSGVVSLSRIVDIDDGTGSIREKVTPVTMAAVVGEEKR